jgi:hypothetical protein
MNTTLALDIGKNSIGFTLIDFILKQHWFAKVKRVESLKIK